MINLENNLRKVNTLQIMINFLGLLKSTYINLSSNFISCNFNENR